MEKISLNELLAIIAKDYPELGHCIRRGVIGIEQYRGEWTFSAIATVRGRILPACKYSFVECPKFQVIDARNPLIANKYRKISPQWLCIHIANHYYLEEINELIVWVRSETLNRRFVKMFNGSHYDIPTLKQTDKKERKVWGNVSENQSENKAVKAQSLLRSLGF